MVNLARMTEQLVLHEGMRLQPYRCSKDKLTVLVGYNLDARGWHNLELILGRPINQLVPNFTQAEAFKVLEIDIAGYQSIVARSLPCYGTMGEVRQRVVVDMAFNMGYKALGFRKAIACLVKGDFEGTSREMLNSQWAYDVGDGPGHKFDRAERLALMMRTNRDYTR